MKNYLSALFLLLFVLTANAQSYYSESQGSFLGFGGAVAISDGEVFVGSATISWPRGSDPAGEVYIYRRDDQGEWAEATRLQAKDGMLGDDFGRSILVDGARLLVGAPGVKAVYVFEKKNGEWSETAKVEASGLKEGAEFAGAYARGGYRPQTMTTVENNVLVTSYNADTNEGAVHVIHQMGMMWMDMGVLTEANAWSLASSGSTLFIGTPSVDGDKGGVLIYEYVDSRNWVHSATLTEDELEEGALFGRSLAADGGRLYVGAMGHAGAGGVLVYEKNSEGAWTRSHTLMPPAADEESRRRPQFGLGLAVSEGTLMVGARNAVFTFDTNDLDAGYTVLEAPDDRTSRGFGVGIALEGDVAVLGSPNADYEAGIASLFERSNSGNWARASVFENDINYYESISGEKRECEEGLVADLFPCDDVDLISFISASEMVNDRGAQLNDIWGWTDPETGREWVLAARTDGLSFVDIGDPSHPRVVGQLMRTEGSPGSTWRDVKVYKDHAYIVSGGAENHGMQIFDLTQLRDVDVADMPVDFQETARYTGIASAHNLIINEDTGFGYAVGTGRSAEGCGGQLHMIDLHDPLNPTFAGCFNDPNSGGTHDAQCVIYHGSDNDYNGKEICLNSNGRSFLIADVTDKSNPVTVANATYPNTAYTHQGWLSEDHNYFYMNDELDEMNKIFDRTRTLVWDVSDLDDPLLVKEVFLSNGASDHNLFVKGNFVYESNYNAGLVILDITDPTNPVEVGHFDTAPNAENIYGFAGSWGNYPFFESGIIAVSSKTEGLFLVRKREIDL